MNKVKYFSILVIIFLTANLMFPAVTKDSAKKIAYETFTALNEINFILAKIKKKEDINNENISKLKKKVLNLKKIKKQIQILKRSSSAGEIKLLNEQFTKGEYSVALKKAVKELFKNIKRIKKIDGGEQIAKIVAL